MHMWCLPAKAFLSLISKSIITHIHLESDIMLVFQFFHAFFGLLICIGSVGFALAETAHLQVTPAILDHIKQIQDHTVEMGSVVGDWNGDILEAIKIQAAADSIITAIEDGTKAANKLPEKMSNGEAMDVKRATKELLKHTKTSLGTITGRKLEFEEAGLTSAMVDNIEDTKKATQDFIAAIITKVKIGKGIARRLGKKISAAFDAALEDLSTSPEAEGAHINYGLWAVEPVQQGK